MPVGYSSLLGELSLWLYICVCVLCYSVRSDSLRPPCSPPGSSVHGILQARILEWVAISFSRGSSRPRDRTPISSTAGGFFTTVPPGKPSSLYILDLCLNWVFVSLLLSCNNSLCVLEKSLIRSMLCKIFFHSGLSFSLSWYLDVLWSIKVLHFDDV